MVEIRNFSSSVEKYFTSEIPGELYYGAKGAIHYVTIAMVIFSRVKITCYFHM